MVLALCLLTVALPCLATAALRVGAFNIQAFGDTKMSNEGVAGIIISVSASGATWGQVVCWGRPKMWLLCQGHMAMDGMASQCWGCHGWVKAWWVPRWDIRLTLRSL